MPLKDYEHWNEEAGRVWWQEEGRFDAEPPEDVEYDGPIDEDDLDRPPCRQRESA